LITVWGIKGEEAIEIHAPLSLSPFGYKIRQGLGLDHYLGHVGYGEPHELEFPLTVPSNFSDPIEVTTWIGWLLKYCRSSRFVIKTA
jgi:hypothetical protein